jgi:predicted aspartyl protease
MRKKLGTFQYPLELRSAGGDAYEEVEPWVDTGSLYSQFPESLLRRLGYAPDTIRRFKVADGNIMERPIGDVSVRIGEETRTVTCVFGPEGADMLLGATTLETFSLAADPVNETLTPIVAMMLRISEASGDE